MEHHNSINAYKGFNADLTCRDFQYEVGKEYEIDGEISTCERGFHACENPLDVFSYYPPSSEAGQARYCEVEQDGVIERREDKQCSSKIHIRAEIGLTGLIKAGVKFILDKVKWDEQAATVGGKDSIAVVTGRGSKAKGALGCWLVLTERDDEWRILDVKAVKVDGVRIKADTWYKLIKGQVVEWVE